MDPGVFAAPPGNYGHVLLVDDTWTTGGHVQSAAAALKAAGASHVTALVLARWLAPERGETASLIKRLTVDYRLQQCPFTRGPCGQVL